MRAEVRENKTTDAIFVRLTSGDRLAWSVTWNLSGSVTPMLVAIFCIPPLINGLGTDRFGLLTLAWAVIGYASLFDFGLGRALTQLVAKKLGSGETRDIPTLVWTSLFLIFLLGLVGAGAVILFSHWFVYRWLHVPTALQLETLHSCYVLGLSIPIVICTVGLRGLLEGQQQFGIVNFIRIPMGVFTFVGPLVVLRFSRSLVCVVAVLVAGRFVAWLAHLVACLWITPALRQRFVWNTSIVAPLLRFGGWMSVTNIVGPLMVNLDRFLIGALLSVTAVAYYVTPYEAVTKLLVIPGAVVSVMFPAFATSFSQDRARTGSLYRRTVTYVLLMLFPLVLFVVAFAMNGLKLWLGAEFARSSVHVLQWLAVGVFLNSLAQVPFALIQGVGRPDLTAKLHLIELPAYLLTLWWLTKLYGIEGTAIAWAARASVDTLALFGIARRFLPQIPHSSRQTSVLLAVSLIVLALAAAVHGIIFKGVFLLTTISIFAVVAWFLVVVPERRSLVQRC